MIGGCAVKYQSTSARIDTCDRLMSRLLSWNTYLPQSGRAALPRQALQPPQPPPTPPPPGHSPPHVPSRPFNAPASAPGTPSTFSASTSSPPFRAPASRTLLVESLVEPV